MQQTETHRKYKTLFAITAIVIAVLALSLGDAVIKATDLSLPLWQMYILRSAIALPILILIRAKRPPIKSGTLFWISIRSGLLVLMWLCYYSALPSMPLALAAAVFYTAPIFITIFAAVHSRTSPPLRTWLAIFLGFFGVMLILRPAASELQVKTLLPLFAAILYALAMMLTAVKCRDDDPIFLSMAMNIAFIIGGGLLGLTSGTPGSFIFGPWAPLDLKLLSIIAVLAGGIVIGSVGAAVAYQNGPPATIAAFDYTYLVFSLIWGVIFFATIPDRMPLIGIFIIMVSGLLALPGSNKTEQASL
ncbi:MAG: DMT family transporter [Desulfobacterales bacterium]|nr:DMT family transporter [Desulfobacterales bacterium]